MPVTLPDFGQDTLPDFGSDLPSFDTPEPAELSPEENRIRMASSMDFLRRERPDLFPGTPQVNSLAPQQPDLQREAQPAIPEFSEAQTPPRTLDTVLRGVGQPLEEPPGITPRMERPENLSPLETLHKGTEMPAPRLTDQEASVLMPDWLAPHVAGVQRSMADFVDFATSPAGIATTLTGGAASTDVLAGRLVSKATATAFAVDMAQNLPGQFDGIIDALKRGDRAEATRGMVNGAAALLMIGHAAKANASTWKQNLPSGLENALKPSESVSDVSGQGAQSKVLVQPEPQAKAIDPDALSRLQDEMTKGQIAKPEIRPEAPAETPAETPGDVVAKAVEAEPLKPNEPQTPFTNLPEAPRQIREAEPKGEIPSRGKEVLPVWQDTPAGEATVKEIDKTHELVKPTPLNQKVEKPENVNQQKAGPIPTVDQLLAMSPDELVQWKRETKYGPDTPGKIAATLTPEDAAKLAKRSTELRDQANDMIGGAQSTSLNSAILREIGEDFTRQQEQKTPPTRGVETTTGTRETLPVMTGETVAKEAAQPSGEKTPVRAKPTFFVRPRSDGIHDVLDAISDLGGIKPPKSGEHGGEYDGYKEAYRGAARLVFKRSALHRPDTMIQELKGWGGGQFSRIQSADDLWGAIRKATREREHLTATGGGHEAQTQRFWSAINDPSNKSGLVRINVQDLHVGDTFRIRGVGISHEELTVTHLDPETGTVQVKDGPKLGAQDLPDGAQIWVQRGSHENPKGQLREEPQLFGKPESVEEQKARTVRETEQQESKAQREKILEQQKKPLVGSVGDIGQADLLGGGDLFSQPVKSKEPLPIFNPETDKIEAFLNKAIEATDPGQQLGGAQVSMGLARLPVWLTKQVAHDALKVVRAAYRASKDVLSAVQKGVDHIRQFNLPGFKEDQARRWLRSGLPEKGSLATLDKLTDYLRSHEIDSPKPTLPERLNRAYAGAKASVGAAADTFTVQWAKTGALWNTMVEMYKRPVAKGSDFRNAIKLWHAMDTRTGYQTYQFFKELRSKVPDDVRRKAITVYLQAGGDLNALAFQHGNVPDNYKAIWKAAQSLTPDELDVADQIKADWQDKLRKGVNAGIADHAQQNYAPQAWKKPPQVTTQLDPKNAGSPYNKLDTRKPFFYYEKTVPTYYDGIMAKGVPRSLDVADLVSYYNHAFNKALSSRAVVKLMADGKAEDGRPLTVLSGRAEEVPNEQAGESYLVDPKYKAAAVSADGRPYVFVEHPALRDWKWVNSTERGDILMKGDMLVHPDHAQFLKNVLGKSALREGTLGKVVRPILKGSAFLKASKFALAPFHVVTEGEHALSHLVSPFITEADRIDFRDKVTGRLIRGGLDLGMNDAHALFSEGMSGHGGLFSKIPGLGKMAVAMSDWTFKDYIPTLKVKVGKKILERNEKRYGKELTMDQIDELTANQVNAAFGGQNYRLLGRNQTTLDILRLGVLAPDFLLSRAKIVGQALKPYGAEQRRMLITQVAIAYIGARILNSILDDDKDPHWDDPFAVYHGGRRYSLRIIAADVVNMFKDPRAFAYGRLAPIAHLGVEMGTGRDWRGIKQSTVEQVGDFLRWLLPVGVEGVVPGGDHPETTVSSAALQAVGVGSRQASATQRVQELARRFNRNSPEIAVRKEQERDDRESHMGSDYLRLDGALRANNMERAKKEYQRLLDDGKKSDVIRRRYSHERGFTGSKKRDVDFIATLTPAQQSLLERAKADHAALYQAFQQIEK